MAIDADIRNVLGALLAQHGPQDWWPADGRFEIMVGAVLVQRTAWRNAALAIDRLRAEGCLAAGRIDALQAGRLEALIKPAGFYRVKANRLMALARFVLRSGGLDALARRSTAALREALLAQRGIGPETADAILNYAFERPVFVVDAYARRLFGRLGFPGRLSSDADLKAACEAAVTTSAALNELHALIVIHGQRYCGTVPDCEGCGLRASCGYRAAHAEGVSRRSAGAGIRRMRRAGRGRRGRADTGTGP